MRHSAQVPFRQSVTFRLMLVSAISVVLIVCLCVALMYILQGQKLEQSAITRGQSFIETFKEQSRHSLEKGQRGTFQDVIDNIVKIDGVRDAGLYLRQGLLNYKANEPTVGKPFVLRDGDFENPNLERYEESRGRWMRSDWNQRDLVETPHAREHIRKKEAEGKDCASCHVALPENLAFDEQGFGYADRGKNTEFYYRVPVTPDCIACHTNWEPGETGGYLSVTLDRSFIDERRREQVVTLMTVLAMTLVPLALIVLIVMRRYVRVPSKQLIDNLDGLVYGDGDLTLRLPEDRRDEFGFLSRQFNLFVDKVQQIVVRIKDVVLSIHQRSSELERQSRSIAGATDEIASQMGSIASTTEEMSASAQEVLNSMEHVQKDIDKVSTSMDQSRRASHQNVEYTGKALEMSGSSAQKIEGLSSMTGNVQGLITQISEVADQTNLLSLNAAIEAARAGEHGRGFAVVADEVRKLSDKTTQLTHSISDILGRFVQEIQGASQQMSQTQQFMDDVMRTSSQTGSSLDESIGHIRQLQAEFERVNSAAQQQTAAITQIAESIDAASTQTDSTRDTARQLLDMAAALNESVNEVEGETSRFRTEVEGETSRFRTEESSRSQPARRLPSRTD